MKKTIKLKKFYDNGEVIWTLPRLSKPLQDYRKAVRKAIGFMNMHRTCGKSDQDYHDDGSPEYYIRRDLCALAEALEVLADEVDPNERDREFYSELFGREITNETLATAKKEWFDAWQKDLKGMQ